MSARSSGISLARAGVNIGVLTDLGQVTGWLWIGSARLMFVTGGQSRYQDAAGLSPSSVEP